MKFIYTYRKIFECINYLISRWQARKEGDKNMRAGLIPSKLLQERRIVMQRVEEGKGIISSYCSW